MKFGCYQSGHGYNLRFWRIVTIGASETGTRQKAARGVKLSQKIPTWQCLSEWCIKAIVLMQHSRAWCAMWGQVICKYLARISKSFDMDCIQWKIYEWCYVEPSIHSLDLVSERQDIGQQWLFIICNIWYLLSVLLCFRLTWNFLLPLSCFSILACKCLPYCCALAADSLFNFAGSQLEVCLH